MVSLLYCICIAAELLMMGFHSYLKGESENYTVVGLQIPQLLPIGVGGRDRVWKHEAILDAGLNP